MMDWKELGKKIVELGAPILGTALGGPGGAALGALVAKAVGGNPKDPADLLKRIEQSSDAMVKLKEIETNATVEIQRLLVQQAIQESQERIAQLQEETNQVQAVNQTMQAESRSEHWPQYSWRPFNGFSFPIAVICIYFLLPLLGKAIPNVPEWVWIGWLSILGVTAYHRGRKQRIEAGDAAPGLLASAIKAIRGT